MTDEGLTTLIMNLPDTILVKDSTLYNYSQFNCDDIKIVRMTIHLYHKKLYARLHPHEEVSIISYNVYMNECWDYLPDDVKHILSFHINDFLENNGELF